MSGKNHGPSAVVEGDPGGAQRFRDLVEAHTQLLYRLACHLTHNRADAEDLVQEAFLRAWRSFHTFQPDTNARAWFTTILRNVYFERYRREKRRGAEPIDIEDVDEWYLYTRVHDADEFRQAGDPVAAFFSALTDDHVASALQTLRPHYREVFILADLAGFSYREISQIVGIPEGTVMSRLYRARRMLQKALWDYCLKTGQCRVPASVPEHPPMPWDCYDACRQISQYLDRTLDTAALAAIDQHLKVCHRCCTRLEFQRRLTTAVRKFYGTAEVPGRFRAQLHAVVRRFCAEPERSSSRPASPELETPRNEKGGPVHS